MLMLLFRQEKWVVPVGFCPAPVLPVMAFTGHFTASICQWMYGSKGDESHRRARSKDSTRPALAMAGYTVSAHLSWTKT